jgi:hypothetical protein
MFGTLFSNKLTSPFGIVLFATTSLMMFSSSSVAQEATRTQSADQQVATSAGPAKATSVAPVIRPVFTEYKGVKIGMSADDVRRQLGKPKESDKTQDVFMFSDKEYVQIYYDNARKVTAVSINYMGKDNDAPAAKDVLGKEPEAKADGSIYELVRYPDAGYWVSYNRMNGDSPLTTVTMQKMP